MDQSPETRRMASAEPFAIRRHALSLVDFELLASIGVHPFEKRSRQKLLISVSLTLDPAHRVRDDDIVTAVDYDFLRTGIRALVESRHYQLQETLVHDILALCSGRPDITGAVVACRKPDVYPDCASVGYEAAAEYRRAGA